MLRFEVARYLACCHAGVDGDTAVCIVFTYRLDVEDEIRLEAIMLMLTRTRQVRRSLFPIDCLCAPAAGPGTQKESDALENQIQMQTQPSMQP